MNPSFVFEDVAEAPMAMPSAAACMTSPVVVARLRVCLGEGARECRKESEAVGSVGEVSERLLRLMCRVGGDWRVSEAWRGSLSTRNMRMKPEMREKPMKNVGGERSGLGLVLEGGCVASAELALTAVSSWIVGKSSRLELPGVTGPGAELTASARGSVSARRSKTLGSGITGPGRALAAS